MDNVRFSPDRARILKRAIEAAERSVQLAPTSVPALITRGWVYIEEGRPAQALKTFERAVELNPKDAWGIFSRGYGLLHLGRGARHQAGVAQHGLARHLQFLVTDLRHRLEVGVQAVQFFALHRVEPHPGGLQATLPAGTLISTGSPGGAGYSRNPQVFLKDGSTVTVTIEGIGSLTTHCRVV